MGRSNVDYVLLMSGQQLLDGQSAGNGKERRGGGRSPSGARQTRHIMLDAGTSTFDSSLYWFTCGFRCGVRFPLLICIYAYACIRACTYIHNAYTLIRRIFSPDRRPVCYRYDLSPHNKA